MNIKFMSLSFFIASFFISINCDAANYQIKEERILPNNTASFRQIEFNQPDLVEVYAVIFSQAPKGRLYIQSNDHQLDAEYLDSISQHKDFLVAINGGFYTQDFKPAGLFKQNGKAINNLAKNKLLATCVQVNNQKKVILEKNRENCLRSDNAMQTGLYLIHDGKINDNLKMLPQKLPKLEEFFSQKRRSVLAETDEGKLVAFVTSPVKLDVLAEILQKYPQVFGTKKFKLAITLDGGSSSSLFIRFPDAPFYFHEIRHVKTFIFLEI